MGKLKTRLKGGRKGRRKRARPSIRSGLKVWRAKAIETYGDVCEWCGSKEYVNVHHIIDKKHPELRFDVDNAMVLCAACHKFRTGMSAHHNPILVCLWLQKTRPAIYSKLADWTIQRAKLIHQAKFASKVTEDFEAHKGRTRSCTKRSS